MKVYTASVNESGIGLVSTRNATAQEQGLLQGNTESLANATNETGMIGIQNNVEGEENIEKLLRQSTCSSDDFYKYLNGINSDYADSYSKTGKWPSEIQIPKSPDVLKADGSIDWSKAPQGGYVLDGNGNAIKESYMPVDLSPKNLFNRNVSHDMVK